MTPKEISVKSLLTEDSAKYIMSILAIKETDEKWIKKLMELANKGYSDNKIIDNFSYN